MSPCTYLVTGAVTGNKDESTMHRIRRTYDARGIKVTPFSIITGPRSTMYNWVMSICNASYQSLDGFCAQCRASILAAQPLRSAR